MRRDARVDHRDADAAAGVARQPVEAAPHLVGADRYRRDRHHPLHPRIPGEVRDVRVLADRDELTAGDVEHRAAAEHLLDPRAVARRERLHLGVGPGDDDAAPTPGRETRRGRPNHGERRARRGPASADTLTQHRTAITTASVVHRRAAKGLREISVMGYPQEQPVVK